MCFPVLLEKGSLKSVLNGGEKGDDDISGSGEGEGSSLDGKADESTAKIAGGQGKRKSRFHAWLDTGMLSG